MREKCKYRNVNYHSYYCPFKSFYCFCYSLFFIGLYNHINTSNNPSSLRYCELLTTQLKLEVEASWSIYLMVQVYPSSKGRTNLAIINNLCYQHFQVLTSVYISIVFCSTVRTNPVSKTQIFYITIFISTART